jgi:Nif-specific regulatory protein
MSPLRSVLWIGSPRGLERSPLPAEPAVDVTWTRDLDEALALPLERFDAVVMDAPAPPRQADTRRLEAAGARTVLVTSEPGRYPGREDLEPRVRLRRRPPPTGVAKGLVAESQAMRATLALLERAGGSAATVLFTGETGTGKEVLARTLHAASPRSARPIVAVNCAAFPDTLLESELFGHAKGAFTGADRPRQGLFEVADGGTLFLDEVGETSVPLQAKLLRALQEREIRPVGGSRARKIDVRVVAATNRDLRDQVARGLFRADLYYRLAVFPIEVPPLRERRGDVVPLAEHFLGLHGAREGKPGCRLSAEALELLLAHAWPGNVRELENEIQRALALSEPGDLIGPERLSAKARAVIEPARELVHEGETLRETLARIETWLLRRALDRHGGRRAETARALGITREGLYKKMKRLGIE